MSIRRINLNGKIKDFVQETRKPTPNNKKIQSRKKTKLRLEDLKHKSEDNNEKSKEDIQFLENQSKDTKQNNNYFIDYKNNMDSKTNNSPKGKRRSTQKKSIDCY